MSADLDVLVVEQSNGQPIRSRTLELGQGLGRGPTAALLAFGKQVLDQQYALRVGIYRQIPKISFG